MRKASVKSFNLRVRSQTCAVLEEGTLQKKRKSSRLCSGKGLGLPEEQQRGWSTVRSRSRA